MGNDWEALVQAQLDARDRNIATGMSDQSADRILVRNLQEYTRLYGLAKTYQAQAAVLRGETPVIPISPLTPT